MQESIVFARPLKRWCWGYSVAGALAIGGYALLTKSDETQLRPEAKADAQAARTVPVVVTAAKKPATSTFYLNGPGRSFR